MTAILAKHSNPKIASQNLQNNLDQIQDWLYKWRIAVNTLKSAQITFTTRKETCPPVSLNGQILPQVTNIKYLGIHLDSRMTFRTHIWTKRKQLGLKLSKYYWLIGRRSQLSLSNKLLIYKTVLKPVWTYGIQLWGTASNSNIEIIQRFQSKCLRAITCAPWFVPNEIIHRDLNIPTVKEEIQSFSAKYKGRLSSHPNKLAKNLFTTPVLRRLKRHKPQDLLNRFK